tara:strand:+ start:222 stop:2402 length:2181 start_codon:yes stop_codon:yes gene_type:complete
MIKRTLYFIIFFLIISLVYLNYFGISTNKFNKKIESTIKEKYPNISIRLKDVRVLFDIIKLSINLETKNPIIIVRKEEIKLNNISTVYKINSIFRNKFAISNLIFESNQNKIKKIIRLFRVYNDSPQLMIIDKIVKDGDIKINAKFNFNEDGKLIEDDYKIISKINKLSLKLFDKSELQNLSLDLVYTHNNLNLRRLSSNYLDVPITSDNILIKKQNENFLINGNLNSLEKTIPKKILSFLIKDYNFEKVVFSSENNFKFSTTKKFKISNLIIDTKINLKEAELNLNNKNIKKYLPSFNEQIKFFDHLINIRYENKLFLDGSGKFQVGDQKENIKYNLDFKNNKINYNLSLNLNKIPIKIDLINFHKNENIKTKLLINGQKNNNRIRFKKILLDNKNSNINLEDFELSENFRILNFKKIELDYVDKNKIRNDLLIKNLRNDNFFISGNNFNLSKIIDDILFNDNDSSLKIFDNKNRNFRVKFKKNTIDGTHYLLNLYGNFQIKNNEVYDMILDSHFSDNKTVVLTIKSKNKKKITTFYSDFAKPFVKKYKFIKGFENGKLDLYSVKENEISNSLLKIYDFRLKELPALTKILTLASLQGIADILSGEGVGFDEFEMKFQNKKNLMDIKEIYAIGPAISILMDGYVQDDELISLRGTLVPATTINKFVASIPILGDILVGKKTGEGVFGVSFKIKGPPKDLKTSVNPIKTLTPRFITRTLEKIKKTN